MYDWRYFYKCNKPEHSLLVLHLKLASSGPGQGSPRHVLVYFFNPSPQVTLQLPIFQSLQPVGWFSRIN